MNLAEQQLVHEVVGIFLLAQPPAAAQAIGANVGYLAHFAVADLLDQRLAGRRMPALLLTQLDSLVISTRHPVIHSVYILPNSLQLRRIHLLRSAEDHWQPWSGAQCFQ